MERKSAFELEYKKPINDLALRDDIISYLGEYRFNIPVYDYDIYFSSDSTGNFSLRDKYDGEPMVDKSIKAINKNRSQGFSTNREEAELKGLLSLETQLKTAEEQDIVIWASPPGPKDEGYGDYGFVYVGSINKTSGEEKKISMTAVRIEKPSIEHFSFYLSFVTGKEINFEVDTDFLKNPFVVKKPSLEFKKEILDLFGINNHDTSINKFNSSINLLTPYINELVRLTKIGAPIEKRKELLNTLENLSEGFHTSKTFYYSSGQDVFKNIPIDKIVNIFGYKPSLVAGSCGSSGESNSIKSNDIFNGFRRSVDNILSSDNYPDYKCPHCGETLSGESKTNKSSWREKCDHCGGKIHC